MMTWLLISCTVRKISRLISSPVIKLFLTNENFNWLIHASELYIYVYIYTGCPKKVETRFHFLDIEDKHAV